ncbi:outer membrane protein assembly factor BamE [Sphaerotilus sp.]|jgi:outer membrane protein assembly factor BamE|uniref:outer membrane protein assembly factor BamE n=1 Tax=Sphaerotilus sp. TaxID=2093942 RepID=UPI00286E20DA|nr:outer membrane protein assembly factor BamE [Sphaerotilus sp.]
MAALTRFPHPVSSLLLMAVAMLAGCSTISSDGSLLGFVTPYRMEVVQGNVVTQDMVAQLRPGLSGDQVRTLLGAPLLNDVFHANRWDYVFTIRRQGTAPQQRRVTVFFENDRVARFEADAVPTEREFVASIDASKPPSRKTVLELDEQQLRAIPVPAPSRSAQPPQTAASGPARSYPPLETSAR